MKLYIPISNDGSVPYIKYNNKYYWHRDGRLFDRWNIEMERERFKEATELDYLLYHNYVEIFKKYVGIE